MTNAALNGFLTRTAACESYDISDRSIGRYLKRAMLKRDESFLKHFKLATLDDQIIEGTKVDLPLIAQLTDQGRVPTWYVSSEWLERNFDPRGTRALHEEPQPEPASNQPVERGDPSRTDSKDEIIVLFKKQVEALERDKEKLEQEKKEMREDARETRKLMNQMQQLMAHMQTRLLPQTTELRPPRQTGSTLVVQATNGEREEGSGPSKSDSRLNRVPNVPATRQRRPKSRPTPNQPPIKPAKTKSIWTRDILDFVPFRRK